MPVSTSMRAKVRIQAGKVGDKMPRSTASNQTIMRQNWTRNLEQWAEQSDVTPEELLQACDLAQYPDGIPPPGTINLMREQAAARAG